MSQHRRQAHRSARVAVPAARTTAEDTRISVSSKTSEQGRSGGGKRAEPLMLPLSQFISPPLLANSSQARAARAKAGLGAPERYRAPKHTPPSTALWSEKPALFRGGAIQDAQVPGDAWLARGSPRAPDACVIAVCRLQRTQPLKAQAWQRVRSSATSRRRRRLGGQ